MREKRNKTHFYICKKDRGRNASIRKVGDCMEFFVNGNIWLLKFVNPLSNDLLRSDMSRTCGVTDNSVKTIFIADNMDDYMTDKVLVHELSHVHAMEYNYSIPIEVEEIVCDFLSLYGRKIIYQADDIMSKIMRSVA